MIKIKDYIIKDYIMKDFIMKDFIIKDYNYIWHGAMEITLELSCCKFPPASELQVIKTV